MVKWERMDKQISKFIEHKTLLKIKKKKNRRMRILGACIFLSLLAGKFTTFEQMLLTEWIRKIF